MVELKCPLDSGKVITDNGQLSCERCAYRFPLAEVNSKKIPDLRCQEEKRDVSLTFSIPQNPLQTGEVGQFGKATAADFTCESREQIRKRYGTKLQKENLYYIDLLMNQVGRDAVILDLGCGNGGNKRYLQDKGFHNILSVDYLSDGAEYLVDVHRMPFVDESFDMIITTATLEHFYNPYIAFQEMARVLKKKGMLIASGSFWESWHGNSCFHSTPGGLQLLCQFSGLELVDMWSGWGFIPSVSSHALRLGRFKGLTYKLQKLFDFAVSSLVDRDFSKRHTFATSGSLGLFAQKNHPEE